MGKAWKLFGILALLLVISAELFNVRTKIKTFRAAPGETVELVFELDKKFELGEYSFDLNNGESATYPLCFCLTEKNTYPPDCQGDVKYIYNNNPGTMCMPLQIATGRCSVKPMSSSGHATVFIIPLEYSWTKPVEKIVLGIRIPPQARIGSRMVVAVNMYKRYDRGEMKPYRKFEQAIEAVNIKK